MTLYDVTRPLFDGHPVWPGDEPCRITRSSTLEEGGLVNSTLLSMPVHVATHADGPFHVLAEGVRIGAAPLDAFLGPARLVDASAESVLDEGWARRVLAAGTPERLLVRTGAWRDARTFPREFVAPDGAAAQLLVRSGLRLFGTDAPSVDVFDSADLPAHRALLGAGAGILENLALDGVPEGEYELIALPLRIADADSSPVRAVLRGPLRPA